LIHDSGELRLVDLEILDARKKNHEIIIARSAIAMIISVGRWYSHEAKTSLPDILEIVITILISAIAHDVKKRRNVKRDHANRIDIIGKPHDLFKSLWKEGKLHDGFNSRYSYECALVSFMKMIPESVISRHDRPEDIGSSPAFALCRIKRLTARDRSAEMRLPFLDILQCRR